MSIETEASCELAQPLTDPHGDPSLQKAAQLSAPARLAAGFAGWQTAWDCALTITGHAEPQQGSNEVAVVHEYPAGTFQRSFTLSEAIDQAQIQATLRHGVLRLRLPKAEQAKPRQIKIQTA